MFTTAKLQTRKVGTFLIPPKPIDRSSVLEHFILSSIGYASLHKIPTLVNFELDMAIPPERITIKRRRDDEPVDTLCKRLGLEISVTCYVVSNI